MADISQQIAQAQQDLQYWQEQLASDQGKLAGQRQRLQDWMFASGGNPDAEAQAAIADAQHWIIVHQQEIQTDNENIQRLKDLLKTLEADLATYNANLAKAAGEGLTGAAAEERARLLTEQAKAQTWAIIGLVVIVGLVIAFWAWRKYIKAK